MKLAIILTCVLVTIGCDLVKQTFLQRHASGSWGQGVSSNSCYNIDYLIRLQRTVDFLDVTKIVEVGFGDWSLTRMIHLEGKQYVGYEIVDGLVENVPENVQLKYISKIQDITEGGDLLIIKDVLMYLPNADILYVISELLPKYKYALIEISAADDMHGDVKVGQYRPLRLSFENGVKVIEKKYKSTRKETWLIRNN